MLLKMKKLKHQNDYVNKDYILYMIRNPIITKIGVASYNYEIKNCPRLLHWYSLGFKLIDYIGFDCGLIIYITEKSLKDKLKNKINFGKINFDFEFNGWSECWLNKDFYPDNFEQVKNLAYR